MAVSAASQWRALVSVLSLAALVPVTARAADEIHWTILGQTAVAFDWRGTPAENTIRFGTRPGRHTRTVTATTPSPTPDSSPGPFWEAHLTGLAENTLYYYRIGGEPEHTFRTPPPRGSAGFWIAQLADIGSSLHYPTVGPSQRLIGQDLAALAGDDRPRFVLVNGDLTYGDQHALADVDAHFNDVMVWSRNAAYMATWGNHEWDTTPGGDDLNDYEGRFAFPNSQTSPGAEAAVGDGPGDDWYWFDYGNTRFIAYPEPYRGAWNDWAAKADTIMAAAQADTAIQFILTFGHRPPWSSGADHGGDARLAARMATLRGRHAKYVLNIAAHSHHYERSDPSQMHGLVHIVSGGGGSSLGGLASPAPAWSAFRLDHLQHVRLHIQPRRIDGYAICGPAGARAHDRCTPGTVADQWTILAPGAGDFKRPR